MALAAHSVKSSKQVVEKSDQLRGRLVGGHPGEAHDVREQDGHVLHGVHVERSEWNGVTLKTVTLFNKLLFL